MSDFYNASMVEPRWQKKWEEAGVFKTDLKKAKNPFYSLVMFPYPSGDKLHVGHWYNYAPADSYARYKKMQGHDVFSPMGFDAFGLPAENYAIKTGVHPAKSTKKNVQTMITQLKRIGCMYDLDTILNTTDPSYYRWTQWLFLEMFKNGLAYKKLGNVNWCPADQTVLANEQVWDGTCERCGSDVIQKPLEQWYWNIKKYAQQLLDGLETLDWPHKTKMMQQNWIGRSEGADVEFELVGKLRGVITWNYGLKPDPVSGNPALKGGVTEGFPHPSTSPNRSNSPGSDGFGNRPDGSGNRGLQAAESAIGIGLQPAKRTVHLVIEPYRREPFFADSTTAAFILRTLGKGAKRHSIILHEACAMPDHIHLLLSFEKSRDLMKDVVRKLKGGSAHDFNERCGRKGALWAGGGHYENVDSSDQFSSVLHYIQDNPTKANLDSNGRILSGLPIFITVFTTRVDTLFSAAFVLLAPEHPLVDAITTMDRRKSVETYKQVVAKKTEVERTDLTKGKTGVFTGAFVINPVNGEKLQVWIADFVLPQYGHGAVFADAHDERDFEFAKQYKLPLRTTIRPPGDIDDTHIRALKACFSGDGVLYDSGEFSGLSSADARTKITHWLEKQRKGKGVITYRLRDWLVSRQRYWGAPIPIVYDPEGSPHPIPEEHLPWLLPTDVAFKPTGTSPLAASKEFIERTEKIFGKGWRPEVDTMDTFVCSSFYYLRYLMQESNQKKFHIPNSRKIPNPQSPIPNPQFVAPALEKKWLPVSMYIGGPEHACMHLIYARFVMMALKDFGHASHSEPFKKLVHQGLITNRGAKMSKSKGNVIGPDSFVEKYGSDVFRMYLMFMGPFEGGGDWSDTGIKGIVRFVDRLWRALGLPAHRSPKGEGGNKKLDQDSEPVQAALHRTIRKVGEDIAVLHFNTAISALMELLKLIEKEGGCSKETASTIALLLGPLAPHLAEELWSTIGGKGFLIEQSWPTFDPALLIESAMTIVVQVNGKVRGDIQVAKDASKDEILELAKQNANVQKYIASGIKKEIYVEGKLVSLVV